MNGRIDSNESLSILVKALQQTVAYEFSHAFDEVIWHIAEDAPGRAREIPTLTAEVIYYAAREAVRNAAKYGRGDKEGAFKLTISIGRGDGFSLQIEDNGVGYAAGEADRLQDSGQGLALHSTMMAVIGGELITESVPGRSTHVLLQLPAGVL